MCDDLGFEKLLSEEGFFASLLGRSPSGGGRETLYGPDLPVVLLTGGPGMGKARLLRAVRDHFAPKVPVIHLDCGSPVYADRAEPEPDARSAATEVLVEAARRLCTWQGTGGSFAFPRLFAGLAMIATGAAEGTPEAVATEVERYEELPQKQRLRGLGTGDFWRGVLRGALRNLLTTLSAQTLDPYAASVGNALLDTLFASLAPRGKAELARIYGAYPGAAGQPEHGLRDLAADFRAGGEDRELAESFLFRALREDLEAAYASASGWLRRVGRPALLLDHADSPLGEQLLRAVLTDRRDGQRDRVVIVGTARRADGGAFLYGGLPQRRVPTPAEFRIADGVPPAWSRAPEPAADGAPLAGGVLLLRMPFLTGDQLRLETERRQRRAELEGGTNRRRVDTAVARLSGGRPHTVIRLAAAVPAFRMRADDNDRNILQAPLRLSGDSAPERPVADVLLQELVLDQLPVRLPAEHQDQWLDLLTHLSVAHDEECADVLLRHHQSGRVHRLTAHHVTQLLTDTGWPRCERHFIGDFGLRQLLVHRLYGLRPDGAAWYADHHLLRDHYALRTAEQAAPGGGAFRSVVAHRMNHHLVSGGVDDVVRHLTATLPGRPQEWCAELLEIAQAPYPGGADARRPGGGGRARAAAHGRPVAARRVAVRGAHQADREGDRPHPGQAAEPALDHGVRRRRPARQDGHRVERPGGERAAVAALRLHRAARAKEVAGMPRWKKILYSVLAAAAAVAAVWFGWSLLHRPDTCSRGVERIGGECIGVNGEGYDFGTPEIHDVARAIARENKKVEGRPHVTVAMMLPLQSDKAALRRQMRSDLQGAYLGQLEANEGEGEPPKIRLVLANPGRDYGQQAKVVDTLLRMADSGEDRLRAVTGFNLSLEATREAVGRLTEHKVPVLASRISGDQIANEDGADGMAKQRFPGLARIIPTNRDAAQALANFNGARGRENRRTVLVHDRRPDSYAESLAKAFGGIEEKGPAGPAAMPFESPAIDEAGSTGNQFTQIANNICDSEADTVYFAGRTLHLRIFALKLAQVGCEGRHYTIISGSDAASLRQDMTEKDWERLRGTDGHAKVTVQYAAPAHPESWGTALAAWNRKWYAAHHRRPTEAELPQYLTEPKAALDHLKKLIDTTSRDGTGLGSGPDLEDSRTMLVYDGLVTIGTALHQMQSGDARATPGLADVGREWPQLQSRHRVRGTSGLICLTSGGNAYDKPVAVVELDPGRQGRGRLKFVGLGWPIGREQPKNCVIPSRIP
ncbi:ABC transporter substrate-binding protein [Streptomyces naphthomycinicus]|uniref:ABC transporter substrate-binding protein n=1 Tax=Streptomyces naphthomycinicus TaxID=2872625 RepID=UPI001CED259D|nr:ABC transporter substrate-binding protein [Streptomyces sp. TML10]